MKDNEIIKALECCSKGFGNCEGCPYDDDDADYVTLKCETLMLKDVLDLINCQKAEIERKHKIVCGYAQAARTIELYLQDFCDKKLPYDEMIADASRKASAEIEKYRHIEQTAKDFWSELKKMSAFKDLQEPTLTELLEYIERTNAEAIKEFWDKAKQTREFRTCPYVYVTDGDNLVKELTEP